MQVALSYNSKNNILKEKENSCDVEELLHRDKENFSIDDDVIGGGGSQVEQQTLTDGPKGGSSIITRRWDTAGPLTSPANEPDEERFMEAESDSQNEPVEEPTCEPEV
ncbi:unnamed protein product [Arctia plantaginis]|uniref:Uncharacterized protein n=1 Tax=Arctia plantaginis TaxID=874455 RepID=A0A8S0ZUN3_ARCPL|nr:unnamed protein product [Arctia plantaginis]CAB3238464.1 unnamed protein product [Arctia plantaginis]